MKLEIYFIRFLYFLLTLFAAGMLSLCLLGCAPVREAHKAKRAYKLFNRADMKSHATVADRCGALFPPTDSVRESIVYKEGKPYAVPGSKQYVYVDCDSAVKVAKNSGTVANRTSAPCPPNTRQIDTVFLDKTTYQVNRAKETAQADTIAKQKAEIASITDKFIRWRAYCIYTWGILAILIILKIAISYIKSKTNILNSVKWLKN